MTNYEQSQAFGGVIDVLEAVGAQYAIWGGMAVVAYGEPRFTQDMDILLSRERFSVSLFVRRLRESYFHVDEMTVNAALGGGFLMSFTWLITSRPISMCRLNQNYKR